MASVKPYPITGVQSLQPELRFNINHFSTAEELKTRWYLFLKGLQALQDQGEDSETPLGYYQIAGEISSEICHICTLTSSSITDMVKEYTVPLIFSGWKV
jgi:hypothetical protein